MLPDKIAGRYRVLRELGRGGMGVVYLCRDDDNDGREVALKVLLTQRLSESGLRHFEEEFRTLTGLSHPNLIEVYDFGRVVPEGTQLPVPFFTMEYVDGETIDRHLQPGSDRFDDLYDCLAQVVQALAYLHGRGIVHQDVKPSNILVTRLNGERKVKVMDLGLAGRPTEDGSLGRIRGTPAYLSPEAARGAVIDPRSDLYSLGCVVYQLSTGRLPFLGANALELLRAHLQEEPLPPTTLNRKIPAELEKLILSLLAKDPGLRPANADRLAERLAAAAGGSARVETPHVRRQRVLGSGFVGRESELARLAALVVEARERSAKLTLLVGEAGIGKSRLLREFQVRSQLDGIDVFVGRVDRGPGSGCAFADCLHRAIRARGPLSPAVLARHGSSLASLVGPLGSDSPRDRAASPPSPEERFGLLAAVSAAVEDLASQQPLILALEDLHAADETTCTILTHLARGATPGIGTGPRVPLLVIGTYRADEVSRSSPLFDLLAEGREEGVLEETFLKPFGPDEAERMLRAMLGTAEIPALFLERILEETHGNPLYLQELVAMLAEEGHIEPGRAEPPHPDTLARVDLPGRVRDLLERRLARLDPEPRNLLRAAAILGGPTIDPDAMAGVTGMKWESVVRQLLALHSAGLVEREDDPSGTPAYHLALPALAALAEEGTPEDERRTLHARAVAYLERRGVSPGHGSWAGFARHAEAAGQPGRAMEAYGRAADLAQELHAHREAIELYGRAIEIALRADGGPAAVLCRLYSRRGASFARVGDLQRAEEDYRWMLARAEKAGNDALRAAAHLDLGRTLSEAGRHPEAQDNLEVAREIAARLRDDGLAAEALVGLAWATFHLGEYERAVSHCDQACVRARHGGDTELEVGALLARGMLHREQGNFRLSLESFKLAADRSGGHASPTLEQAIEEGSGLALEVQGDYRGALAAYGRARDRARERGDVRAAASLTNDIGATHVKLGEYEKARQELEQALAAQRRLGAGEGVILSQLNLAVLQVYRSRYEPALEAALEALRLARRIGKSDLVARALDLCGRIHLRMGDPDGARRHLEEAERLVRDARSPRSLAVFLIDLGELCAFEDHGEDARRHYQEATFLARKVGDRRLEAVAMCRLGEAHLLDNNHDRARVACRKALELVEGSGLPREEADALLLRARIELARPGGDIVRAEMDAAMALDRYRSLSEPEQIWQAEHLVARSVLRLGRADEAAGRVHRAHRYLEAVRSRLGEKFRDSFLRDPRRKELYDDWERLRDRVSESAPAVLGAAAGGDFARLQEEAAGLRKLLEINRSLNSTRETDELLKIILDAALELTGGERGFVLLRDGSEVATRQARALEGSGLIGTDLAVSRSIARQAMESGEPVLSTDADADERFARFESVRDLRIRSVLAAPLRIKDDIVGAIYLDHRFDRKVFTPVHLEITTRLADQAALALDTARLVQQVHDQAARLERLNRELERTVQSQRTELASVREELSLTRSSFELRYRFEDLIGASQSMQRIYHLIERVAPKKLPVLITGESGTGKELVARALHSKSERAQGPFFSVNCAAISESLLESELFGYRKGAFTGADRDKPGYFELAHGGTLFLDEVGEMGPAMQAKLLRVIERGEVLPVGGKSPVRFDTRIVSATNRDLEASIAEGSFREDLYYRINVARIQIPPLRERPEDIPLLVEHSLARLAEEDPERGKLQIEPAALERLASHRWPGNVRELQHRLLRMVTYTKRSTLTLRDVERYAELPDAAFPNDLTDAEPLVESLEESERRQIVRALEQAGGNKTRAAQALGINRATLFRKLKRLEH
jgi:transcriptional regulator with GAF, ATPase, and Fis domain/predicted Ser/Thr protein kinase/DNA-binding MarR family transcriptional regulator